MMTCAVEEDRKGNGRWTKEEHQKFMLGLQLYGKDWKKIESLLGSRNGAQIRSHAQKFFIKTKRDPNSHEINDHSEQTKESPPESLSQVHSASLPPQMAEPETNPDFSYYLNKIVQKDALRDSFDFWGSLVDHKSADFELPETQLRKCSFVSLASESEEVESESERLSEGRGPERQVEQE